MVVVGGAWQRRLPLLTCCWSHHNTPLHTTTHHHAPPHTLCPPPPLSGSPLSPTTGATRRSAARRRSRRTCGCTPTSRASPACRATVRRSVELRVLLVALQCSAFFLAAATLPTNHTPKLPTTTTTTHRAHRGAVQGVALPRRRARPRRRRARRGALRLVLPLAADALVGRGGRRRAPLARV